MGTITALTPQQRNKNRVNVFLDGAFAFGLPIAAAQNLSLGQQLTPAELEVLKHLDLVDKAKNSALRFLSYRMRSIAEVRQNLKKKEYAPEIIDEAVSQLEAQGWLDDVAFAEYWAEQRETFKPRGRVAVAMELRQKGVERSIIDHVLEDMDEDAAAQQAALKKARSLSHLPQDLFKKKLGQFLQRRGFRYEQIRSATAEAWQEFGKLQEDLAENDIDY